MSFCCEWIILNKSYFYVICTVGGEEVKKQTMKKKIFKKKTMNLRVNGEKKISGILRIQKKTESHHQTMLLVLITHRDRLDAVVI